MCTKYMYTNNKNILILHFLYFNFIIIKIITQTFFHFFTTFQNFKLNVFYKFIKTSIYFSKFYWQKRKEVFSCHSSLHCILLKGMYYEFSEMIRNNNHLSYTCSSLVFVLYFLESFQMESFPNKFIINAQDRIRTI